MILKPKSKETQEQELQRLREEMARMTARIAELSPGAPAPQPPAADAEISDEELAVISAAVYASVGTNVTIQAIRQTATRTWAAQGRAFIQSLRNLRIKPRTHR